MQDKKYEICLEWTQFEEYFLENYTVKTAKTYKELYMDDDNACINYWYGDSKNGKIQLFWTFSLHEHKIHNVSYTDSSPFAMFWVSATDGNEPFEDSDEEEEHCPYCHDKKEVDCPYCHTKLSPK